MDGSLEEVTFGLDLKGPWRGVTPQVQRRCACPRGSYSVALSRGRCSGSWGPLVSRGEGWTQSKVVQEIFRVSRQKSDSCGDVDGRLEDWSLLGTPLGRRLQTGWGRRGAGEGAFLSQALGNQEGLEGPQALTTSLHFGLLLVMGPQEKLEVESGVRSQISPCVYLEGVTLPVSINRDSP